MSLDTYANLQLAVGKLLDRTDLAAYIPDWIALCEAALKRDLKRTVARQQYTVSDEVWTMPSEVDELRSIRLVTGSPSLDFPIAIVTPEDAADFRAEKSNTAGRPQHAFIAGRDVILAPPPDQLYTIEVTYYVALTPLSASATTNAVLQEAPDAYLYGAAVHSAPFLGDDARLPMWQQMYQATIDALNQKREREEYGGSLRPIRLPRVFG